MADVRLFNFGGKKYMGVQTGGCLNTTTELRKINLNGTITTIAKKEHFFDKGEKVRRSEFVDGKFRATSVVDKGLKKFGGKAKFVTYKPDGTLVKLFEGRFSQGGKLIELPIFDRRVFFENLDANAKRVMKLIGENLMKIK